MFFYFFEEYKEKIYKGSRRKFKLYELLMLTITIAVTLLFLLAVALNWGTIAKASLFAMLLIAVIGAWIYTN